MPDTANRERVAPKKEKNAPKSREKRKESRELDRELDDSFPASDPPSITQPAPHHDD